MYEVTTTYGYHDFLPSFNPNVMMAEVVADPSDAIGYSVADFSGGLYESGPYASAYGTFGLPLVFRDICGNISWEGQTEFWGNILLLDGGVNSVDQNTGIITISWFCDGYGENGVSVYVPQ